MHNTKTCRMEMDLDAHPLNLYLITFVRVDSLFSRAFAESCTLTCRPDLKRRAAPLSAEQKYATFSSNQLCCLFPFYHFLLPAVMLCLCIYCTVLKIRLNLAKVTI